MHAAEELILIAIVALAALLCGLISARLRQPPVVGYIVAGIVLGPSGLELVKNETGVALLAELGVLMLLFVVGMELSLRSFRRIWVIAVSATALQILGTLGVMFLIGHFLNWPFPATLLLAFSVALSSTAVAIKMLDQIGELRTPTGQIAIGVLIAQDLAVVPMMLALDVAALGTFDTAVIIRIVLSVVLLAALIIFLSRRRRIVLPQPAMVEGHPDLMPVLGLAICFGAATVSGLLGLSPAYGAFLAGLTIGNSNMRAGMLETTLPIQGVLMMVFFLSVGLLIDLSLVWQNLWVVLMMLLVVTLLKTILNVGILRVMGLPWAQAMLTGLILAQVGEFSFLLASIGVRSQIIEAGDFRLVITVTALSLALSSLWLTSARRLHDSAVSSAAPMRQVLSLVYGREAGWVAAGARGTGIGLRRLFGRREPAPKTPPPPLNPAPPAAPNVPPAATTPTGDA